MMKTAILLSATAMAVCEAATTVSVLDFGSSVRRTTATNPDTTVHGVSTFWGALHHNKIQTEGMTVVPDLFSRPEASVVVGIMGSGVDLDNMPTVNGLVNTENVAKGHLVLEGQKGKNLLHKIGPARKAEASDFVERCKHQLAHKKVSAVSVKVNSENAVDLDTQIAALIKELQGRNVVVHLVVEEGEGVARRRLSTRRLEDEQQNDEEEDEQDNNGNNNNNAYYGYGYYDADGDFITPYKTMFQIQYFNVVLWVSVGLAVSFFYGIFMTLDMPLEADTLLFGESAKMMGE
eukprot:CAMPEP_0202445044 /NCGR_PEP_ID=MMETSP1360-20130828/3927_1 /ASSEMBLY_ACC=CAM_ASM_000848 /TAXON_ID=515479 /ORGANISM="Licmophora paradoxa, Strain CCMP2313" /LENGTH=290 /DNA_ID=CAMNT_0049061171 /DNA_START=46 /DNA_END=918 /DNA_ORIENTATION=+